MEVVFLLAHLSLVQAEKRSFGLPQAGRHTTVVAGITGRLRAVVIRINRVGIAVRFAGVGGLFYAEIFLIYRSASLDHFLTAYLSTSV